MSIENTGYVDFEKTPKKTVSKVIKLIEFNKYGIRFGVPDRAIKTKNYLNRVAKAEKLPYMIFQQDNIWFIIIGLVTYEFESGTLYLFD
jgi:hypothetical protein